jgi:phytoene dehydrogenase-like protein
VIRSNVMVDVAIIGAGHNGLVAAFYLARAGFSTLVVERRDIVGGACVTEEFAPGFRASPGAYVLSMLRPAVMHDLRLSARGLTVSPGGPSLTIFPDGSSFTLHADPRDAAEEIRRLDPRDATAFPSYEHRLATVAEMLLPLTDRAPVDPRLRRRADLFELARVGAPAARHRRDLAEAAYLFSTSVSRYLDERFRSEHLKAALGWESISNTLAGPSSPGTAYGLLHEAASGASGGGVGWGFVRGGMGELTRLIAEAAHEVGAEIRTGTSVAQVRIERGRATGLVLDNGDEIAAGFVVSNADPRRTYGSLVGSEHLPSALTASIGGYKIAGASMKINLAVAELPRRAGERDAGPSPYHRGLIQITKPLDELDADQAAARAGVPAERPHLEVCIPSVHDASLAPEGRHVVTVGARSQPYGLSGTTWEAEREVAADRIVAQLGEVFPNLPRSVLHREVLSPLDLERRLALTGGHHLHGDMSPDQLYFLRPVRGYAGYRTPVPRLYLCGAGTHPGGGVTGANGRNAAHVIIRDARKGRR